MTALAAYAKINLALVVGERRADGLHEVATVLQRIDLSDDLELAEARELIVEGFPEDTLVRRALSCLAAEAGTEPRWRVRIRKRIPVGAGLGGGSADAGSVLTAANRLLAEPLPRERLLEIAASLGADVPFFLERGPKLAEGAGERLTALVLPQEFTVVIGLPGGAQKTSTADVYRRFDELGGGAAFARRRAELLEAVAACRFARDLARLPPNDLALPVGPGPLGAELLAAGAFRADVSGAGPAVYGLFHDRGEAERAARRLAAIGDAWVVGSVW